VVDECESSLNQLIIEDSATYKVALGFDKGNVGAVSTGGKKVIEQYQLPASSLSKSKMRHGVVAYIYDVASYDYFIAH
jgi:hypothetical protein